MALLHDAAVREAIETRLRALRSDDRPRWGKMTPGQMVWHLNAVLEQNLGLLQPELVKLPLPRPVLKFIVLKLPWMKNGPTNPAFVAKGRYDLNVERSRCLGLIDIFVRRSPAGIWQDHPFFGPTTGTEFSQLQAKHFNHHLSQFGV